VTTYSINTSIYRSTHKHVKNWKHYTGIHIIKYPCLTFTNLIYIADQLQQIVHIFYPNNTYRTYLGDYYNSLSNSSFKVPYDVKIGPDGLVYVVDTGNFRIQVYTDITIFSTISSNFWNKSSEPIKITFDPNNNLYVLDTSFYLTIFSVNRTMVSRNYIGVAGGITFNNGYLFITNQSGNSVVILNAITLQMIQKFGDGIAGVGDNQFNIPSTVSVGPDGNLYIVDSKNFRIQILTPIGKNSTFTCPPPPQSSIFTTSYNTPYTSNSIYTTHILTTTQKSSSTNLIFELALTVILVMITMIYI